MDDIPDDIFALDIGPEDFKATLPLHILELPATAVAGLMVTHEHLPSPYYVALAQSEELLFCFNHSEQKWLILAPVSGGVSLLHYLSGYCKMAGLSRERTQEVLEAAVPLPEPIH